MKILVKAFCDTYKILEIKDNLTHCTGYMPFLWRNIFRQLGHECNFIGPTEVPGEIITDPSGYDVLFYWNLESYYYDRKYAEDLLKRFKGKKVLYITTDWYEPIMDNFDYIFPVDCQSYIPKFQKNNPKAKVNFSYFASPIYDWIDSYTNNPYPDDKPRATFIGIIRQSYLDVLNKLAERGINISLGGTYYPPKEKHVRGFTEQEVKDLVHPNILLFTKDGTFKYGEHWPFLKHANLAINFYSGESNCNSKLIDYLVCGLPVISEEGSANSHHIDELFAGTRIKNNSFDELLISITNNISVGWIKEKIQKDARERFDPLTIGQQILDKIK